ncbi:Bifunctional protein Aas [Planctomycetes bacterium Pan216]|uniref:Bifunctional protein Aas n=1 Tax=Kolteria novifilia TaxID=2527975 RepID=A0A518B1G9_9BACT|nr:Bifunctional protein Aas [Planctomycetes bacterium Pan216]
MNSSDRRLGGLLVAQFFGAFNDNAWKLIVAFLAMRALAAPGEAIEEAASQRQLTIAMIVFSIPYILASLPAGLLADRVSKRSVIIGMKVLELFLMGLGTYFLWSYPGGGWLALSILGLMGLQSAIFSPAKYGILPELLPHTSLSRGNGLLEMASFLAIVTGQFAGGFLLDTTARIGADATWMAGGVLTLFALVGLVASFRVPPVPAAGAQGGLLDSVATAWKEIRSDRILGLAVLGQIYFWSIASLVGQDVIVYAKASLELSDTSSTVTVTLVSLGIGLGSMLAARLSAAKVESGLLPIGATGLSLGLFFMGIVGPEFFLTLFAMTFIGISGGLIIVPLNALLQWRSTPDRRGAVIALTNLFVLIGVVGGSVASNVLSGIGLSAREIFIGAALVTTVGTIWATSLVPEACLRLIALLMTSTFYRLKVIDRDHVPETGGVLLVPNHVSFVDGILLMASIDRPIRFLAYAQFFDYKILGPMLKMIGAIPIASSGGAKETLRSLRRAGKYLDEGEVVCIFPEGQLSRTGMTQPFQRGMERIIKGRTSPIVPVHLDRLWGSIFSRADGRYFTKLPRRLPYPVTISFGEPVPAGTPIAEIRQRVVKLGQSAWKHRCHDHRPLHDAVVVQARRHPFRMLWADSSGTKRSALSAVASAVVLARLLEEEWKDQQRVGVLLPPCVAGAAVNTAASLSGKTSVNLNYTVGPSVLASAVEQSGIKTVVTNREFLQKARVTLPEDLEPIWVEDLPAKAGVVARLSAWAAALLLPVRALEVYCGATRKVEIDDVATIIFSSGSTGEPKGVMLTHENVGSNVEALSQVFHFQSKDRLLAILPQFHSFGYLSLWFAAANAIGQVFHPNPLDLRAIGGIVESFRCTLMLATPTFLQLYQRRIPPHQFGSLRLIITGAEKLPDRVRVGFEEQFGLRPLEGYGSTECSPVIAVSTPDFRGVSLFQRGSRRGSVGQPLPGVAVKIVDPDTREPVPTGESGMLLVKGPNVMKGYLGRDDLTAEVLNDGWYVTGDIAKLDEEGFLSITDRLSRFSKIGGEMVPHGRVEETLESLVDREGSTFAVTSVTNEAKGEQLAVLHTYDEEKIPDLLQQLKESGLPNLFIPRADQFISVEEIPLLGTGKTDLKRVKQVAQEALNGH